MTHEIETSNLRTFEPLNNRATDLRTHETARQELLRMLTGPSRWIGADPEPSHDELMQEIVNGIKEDRRSRGEGPDVAFSSNPDIHRAAP